MSIDWCVVRTESMNLSIELLLFFSLHLFCRIEFSVEIVVEKLKIVFSKIALLK